MKHIAILSCGRSDYSYYKPLIKALQKDTVFSLDVIAFGTHTSEFFGKTVNAFEKDGIEVKHQVESLVLGDSPEAIATAMGLTTIKFSSIFKAENYDLIIVLGDRYEMFAATQVAIPFNIPVAHLYGGETTLGAIDDVFRNAITVMSSIHFTSTEQHAQRVKEMLGTEKAKNVYNVGALSLDNLKEIKLLSKKEIFELYEVDLNKPTILCTYHPETVNYNPKDINEVISAIKQLNNYQWVITLPNNDTHAFGLRKELIDLMRYNNIHVFEALGVKGYFSMMKHAALVFGNSSSGIIEAASFEKNVVNIGNRQKGRTAGGNVVHVPCETNRIVIKTNEALNSKKYLKPNIYGDGNAVNKIITSLKSFMYE